MYMPAVMALLCGALIFFLWLFSPLGLDSSRWNFGSWPSPPVTIVIFFASGLVPSLCLSWALPRLREWIDLEPEEGSSFSRGTFLGPAGSLLLVLTCLPGIGRTDFHQVAAIVVAFLLFLLVPSAILGRIVGVYLPKRPHHLALIPAIIFASGMTGYLFLKVVVRIFL